MEILNAILKFVEVNLAVIVAATAGWLFGDIVAGAFKALGNGIKALSK